MSKSKRKGTSAETALVGYLRNHGFPNAERRALSGINDKGDISGTGDLVWECKNQKSYKLSEWMREAQVESANAGADLGMVIIKPVGVGLTSQSKWWAMLELADMVDLLKRAGYGS